MSLGRSSEVGSLMLCPHIHAVQESSLRSAHGKVRSPIAALSLTTTARHIKLDVANAGRGRRVRKPSDKALAAAQSNFGESSSDEGTSSESRPVRVAMTRNKTRKRRSEVRFLVFAEYSHLRRFFPCPFFFSQTPQDGDDNFDERRSGDSAGSVTRAHGSAEKRAAIQETSAAPAPAKDQQVRPLAYILSCVLSLHGLFFLGSRALQCPSWSRGIDGISGARGI